MRNSLFPTPPRAPSPPHRHASPAAARVRRVLGIRHEAVAIDVHARRIAHRRRRHLAQTGPMISPNFFADPTATTITCASLSERRSASSARTASRRCQSISGFCCARKIQNFASGRPLTRLPARDQMSYQFAHCTPIVQLAFPAGQLHIVARKRLAQFHAQKRRRAERRDSPSSNYRTISNRIAVLARHASRCTAT